jgi:hypothetical protein
MRRLKLMRLAGGQMRADHVPLPADLVPTEVRQTFVAS